MPVIESGVSDGKHSGAFTFVITNAEYAVAMKREMSMETATCLVCNVCVFVYRFVHA